MRLPWKLEHAGRLEGELLKQVEDHIGDKVMRKVIKDQNSTYIMINGVLQGLVLEQSMFSVCKNNEICWKE